MLEHDNHCHHPLGGASYYFKKNLIPFLLEKCPRRPIVIHLGAQPNNNPHIGNAVTFTTAFALAAALKKQTMHEVRVKFVSVDTAPAVGRDVTIDDVRYQVNLAVSGEYLVNRKAFEQLLLGLSSLSGIPVDIEDQSFWRRKPQYRKVLLDIISKHDTLGPLLSPESHVLALRAPCPQCGLEDKHGLKNRYVAQSRIVFTCPVHGEHEVDLRTDNDKIELGMNTPLRNLVRALLSRDDQEASWILCTGGDYAGFYQEQLLYSLGEVNLPVIFYAPLILDWSGSKLSKSLYVKDGAYEYLRKAGLEYMLDIAKLLEHGNGLSALLAEVTSWVTEPHKLFRHYSIEYLHQALLERGLQPI